MGILKLEEIERIVRELLREYGAEHAILFGSYARCEANADSDIDLIIFGGEDFIPKRVLELAEDLRERTSKNADVFEIREVDERTAFYQNVLREGIRISA